MYNFSSKPKPSQDWQLEAYDRKYNNNSEFRHRNVIGMMESQPTTWGVNMSKRGVYES